MKTCIKCLMKKGFSPARDNDRVFETDEQLYEHIENAHGTPVIREGETKEAAIERCAKKGIVSDRSKCICEECKQIRKDKR